MVLRLKKFSEFLDSYNRFHDDKLAILLDLEDYIDNDDIDQKHIYNLLQQKLLS